jgi:O-antigen/teichoic acid export membrane protein
LIKFDFNKLYIKNALSYGLPLIPHALAGTIFSMTDRLFITNMVGIEETGIYTVGFQVGSIIGILATSFNNAYVPWLYEKLKRNEKKINLKIVKLTYLYFIIILLLSILIGGVSKFLFQVFLGVNYLESAKYVIWIAISFALNGMYFMVVNFIFYAQKNKLLAITTFCASLLNFLFNYLFIKMNGPIGAAQATVLIYFLKFIVVWKLSSKIYRMPWREGLSDFFKIRGDI